MNRIVTAVAALLFSVATFAQQNDAPPPPPPPQGGQHGGQGHGGRPPMTPEQRAKRETDKINEMVPLGAAYQKVLDVNTTTEAKRASIAKGVKYSDLTDDQKAQMKALREAHRKDLEAAMGKELFEKFKAAEKAKREERKEKEGGEHGEPHEDGR